MADVKLGYSIFTQNMDEIFDFNNTQNLQTVVKQWLFVGKEVTVTQELA